mgnify:CR=1 FL=1
MRFKMHFFNEALENSSIPTCLKEKAGDRDDVTGIPLNPDEFLDR